MLAKINAGFEKHPDTLVFWSVSLMTLFYLVLMCFTESTGLS